MKKSPVGKFSSPRLRFNWGYHDARTDKARGNVMTPRAFDDFYYEGYRAGRRAAPLDSVEVSPASTAAWRKLLSGKSAAELMKIRHLIHQAELAER